MQGRSSGGHEQRATGASFAAAALAAVTLLVFVPNAVVTLADVGRLVPAEAVVTGGTVLYVAGGAAVPVWVMLAYAAGARWRTGPWEESLRDRFTGRATDPTLGLSWAAVTAVAIAGSVVAPGVVTLGVVQFGLQVGGLLGYVTGRALRADATAPHSP